MVARSRWIGLVVGSTLVWCSAGCSGPNPPPKPPPPVATTGVKRPEKKSVPPPKKITRGPYGVEFFDSVQLVLAYQDVEGIPYVRTRDEIERIRRLLQQQGIVPIGFPCAIYLDDPRTVDTASYRYRVASPVPPTAFPRKPLHRGILEAQRFARVVHEGDYDESYQVRHFEEIPRALEKMDYTIYGPILEVYRYSVAERNPENWVTEVWYPVKKQEKKRAKGPRVRGAKEAPERPGKGKKEEKKAPETKT